MLAWGVVIVLSQDPQPRPVPLLPQLEASRTEHRAHICKYSLRLSRYERSVPPPLGYFDTQMAWIGSEGVCGVLAGLSVGTHLRWAAGPPTAAYLPYRWQHASLLCSRSGGSGQGTDFPMPKIVVIAE